VTGVRLFDVRVCCDNRGAGAAHAVWVDPCVRSDESRTNDGDGRVYGMAASTCVI
jgi:hypothetical protein